MAGLHICLWPLVTLTYELLTPKVFHSPALWTTCASWHQSQLIRFQNIMFTSLVTD